MKPERALIAARAAANHCAQLVRTAPGADQLLPLLERSAERFARVLAPALAPLMGGGRVPTVKAQAARTADLSDLLMFSPDLAANSLLESNAAGGTAPLLVTIDAAAILRMVDRTFGGRGEAPSPLPDAFPGSAELMVRRVEGVVASHLAAALTPGTGATVKPIRRDSSLVALEPFAPGAALAIVELDVHEPGGDTWLLTLALPLAALPTLFGGAPRSARVVPGEPADPAARPFGAVPLTLTAVLVDMTMPMAVAAALEPGMIVPVAVARQVPLQIAGLTIATGTVGAADDRVALQITAAF
ncbi:MAG: FliM/FliN family flagellar motor switch protein [Pseudomonadota bacterium]